MGCQSSTCPASEPLAPARVDSAVAEACPPGKQDVEEDHTQPLTPKVVEPSPEPAPASAVEDDVDAKAQEEAENAAASYLSSRLFLTDSRSDPIKTLYDMDEVLGTGTYGAVCRARRKADNKLVAVKSIPKSRKENRALGVPPIKQELVIMRMMDHPNVIKLFESFEDRFHVHLVMELCSGRTLYDAMAEAVKFREHEAAALMQQILIAIHYVHGRGVCHRDIKPENLLFETECSIHDCCLKLADFGFSCMPSADTALNSVVGTPHYVAPEVLQGRYDEMCDLWSSGVILYVMLSGVLPFYADTEADLQRCVLAGRYVLDDEHWKGVSSEAKGLVSSLLKANPSQRLSAEQALQTRWIADGGWGVVTSAAVHTDCCGILN